MVELIKRPCAQETEQDLLALQQEFNHSKSSVKVIKTSAPKLEPIKQLTNILSDVVERFEDSDEEVEWVATPQGFPQPKTKSELTEFSKKPPVPSLEAQELIKRLDPKIISFLKNRKHSKNTISTVDDVIDPNDVTDDKEVREVKQVNQDWNMETVLELAEPEKVEWIKGITEETKDIRFDFQGQVVTQDHPTHSGLYHHGKNPEKAGYTIEELLHLSRSTVPSQRSFGLSRLTFILDNCHDGTYTNLKSILAQLISSDLVLLLRIAIDASGTVLTQGLKALYSLYGGDRGLFLYDKAFESSDSIIPTNAEFIHNFALNASSKYMPEFEIHPTSDSIQDIRAISKTDITLALLATNILVRFTFLLEKPNKMIFDLLTKIALHSTHASLEILATPGLIDLLLKHLEIPEYSQELLLLFRILCQSSKKACSALVNYGLMDRVAKYLPNVRVFYLYSSIFFYKLGYQQWTEYRGLLLESCRFPGAPRMLTAVLKFGSLLQVGGLDDVMLPFALEYSTMNNIETREFLIRYFELGSLFPGQQTPSFLAVVKQCDYLFDTMPTLSPLSATVPMFPLEAMGIGLTNPSRIALAQDIMDASRIAHHLALLLGYKKQTCTIKMPELDHSDWLRCFTHGYIDVLKTVLNEQTAMTLITFALPGDEYLVSKCLDYIPNADLFRQELAGKYNESVAFWCQIPETCFMETSIYPLRKDWPFIPLERTVTQYRRQGQMNDLNVLELLKFIQKMNDFILDDGLKLIHFMTVFLLSKENSELFFDPEISQLLDWGIQTWSCGDLTVYGDSFYNFYQELVRHYCAVSYAHPVFSKYIVLPLAMNYPYDFRMVFWSQVGEMVHNFPNVPLTEAYLSPKETHEGVLKIYSSLKGTFCPFITGILQAHQ